MGEGERTDNAKPTDDSMARADQIRGEDRIAVARLSARTAPNPMPSGRTRNSAAQSRVAANAGCPAGQHFDQDWLSSDRRLTEIGTA
jgi:hypothetical protein